jgi:hypothetical protein
MWQVLIRSKDEAFEAFKKVKAAAETDHGGEFTSMSSSNTASYWE